MKTTPVQITTDHLTRVYEQRTVLNSINFTIQPGEVFVIMGPSGTGKSVLLKLLAGLDTPTSGQVCINNIPLNKAKKQKGYVLGLVFQSGALFNSLSVFDNLALYLREHRICSEEEVKKRIKRVLELVNLKGVEELMPFSLSGGMKKRVALARGLLMEPDVLLFDEPTSELDPISAASIIELIGYINRTLKITTVVSTHDILLAKTIGTHIVVLENGRFDTLYTPETLLKTNNSFIDRFLNPIINIEQPQFKDFLA